MIEILKRFAKPASRTDGWRYGLLLSMVLGSLVVMLSKEPIGQSLAYHHFADHRLIGGVPNFLDVISNLPFLLIGIAGVIFCLADRGTDFRSAWLTLFLGVALVSAGSAWYHLHPDNQTLVWDRLPMTIGFMGLFAALLGEHASLRLGRSLLIPLVLLGFSSVLYWQLFDDLRFYYWIQLFPLLTIPVVMILFRPRYSHQWILAIALAFYALAKVAEALDQYLYTLTGNAVSGHTLKHLLAAMACLALLVMLRLRKPLARHGDA